MGTNAIPCSSALLPVPFLHHRPAHVHGGVALGSKLLCMCVFLSYPCPFSLSIYTLVQMLVAQCCLCLLLGLRLLTSHATYYTYQTRRVQHVAFTSHQRPIHAILIPYLRLTQLMRRFSHIHARDKPHSCHALTTLMPQSSHAHTYIHHRVTPIHIYTTPMPVKPHSCYRRAILMRHSLATDVTLVSQSSHSHAILKPHSCHTYTTLATVSSHTHVIVSHTRAIQHTTLLITTVKSHSCHSQATRASHTRVTVKLVMSQPMHILSTVKLQSCHS